jgi:uncharacterized lipoprotein YehR (DUF1307 family)
VLPVQSVFLCVCADRVCESAEAWKYKSVKVHKRKSAKAWKYKSVKVQKRESAKVQKRESAKVQKRESAKARVKRMGSYCLL